MGEMLIWFEPYSSAYNCFCLCYINDSGSNSRSLEINHLDPFGLTPSNVVGVLILSGHIQELVGGEGRKDQWRTLGKFR